MVQVDRGNAVPVREESSEPPADHGNVVQVDHGHVVSVRAAKADPHAVEASALAKRSGRANLLKEPKHATDAYVTKAFLLAVCFRDESARDEFVKAFADQRGQLHASPIVKLVLDIELGAAHRNYKWRSHLPEILTAAKKCRAEDPNAYKKGGQVGECVHDYT